MSDDALRPAARPPGPCAGEPAAAEVENLARAVTRPSPPAPSGDAAPTPPALDATRKTEPGKSPPSDFERTRTPESPLTASRINAAGRFGRYEIQGEIARGGMGVVYRARQTDIGRTVALKVMLAGDMASPEDERRFLREAEAAGQLSHPNIVGVHDVGREGDRHYFTMDLVDGRPLTEWSKGKERAVQLRVLAQVCRGVHHAHMKGIIHRDLKPGNILVTAADEPKILDFGLAKIMTPGAESMNTMSGAALGTPFYMAPEQAAGKIRELDIRTDVFALGVILYELIAGRVPFSGESLLEVLNRIQQEEPAPLAAPLDLRLVVQKALEKDKARRYATAEALAEDLERYVAGDPVSARPPGVGFLARRWARRHPALAASGAAGVAVLAAMLAWQFTRPGEITVTVDPPAAWVRIDGRPAGRAASVTAGRHDLRVGAEGFEDEAREIDVARGELRAAEFHLRRSTGALSLDTDTEGSVVEIEGEVHGTPLTRHALPAGDYRVTIRRREHESRRLAVTIRRGETTTHWVALPHGPFWFQQVPDCPATPVWLRDVNGDGFPDVGAAISFCLKTYDGRTGELLLDTPVDTGTPYHSHLSFDVDGDGVPDDIVTYRIPPAGSTPRVVRVRAFAGRPAASPAQTGAGKPQAQRKLWERDYPSADPGVATPSALPAGADLWVPVPEGLERLEGKTGRTLAAVRLAQPPGLMPIEGAADVLAVAGRTILRLGPTGEERWRIERAEPAWPVSERDGSFPTAGARRAVLYEGGAMLALDPADGSVLWRAPLAGGGFVPFLVPGDGSDPGAVVAATKAELVGLDAATGAERFRLTPGLVEKELNLASAAPGLLFTAGPGALVARSARTGEVVWRADLAGELACPAAWAQGRSGLEIYAANDKSRLMLLDAAGREVREYSLRVPPGRITPCTLDTDGRTDLALTGNGVQCLRPSRVLWQRTMTNAVRSRPVVIDIGGTRGVVLACKWEDARSELRCLKGATGEVLWRFGDSFDVIFEPVLKDVDGDGILDVGLVSMGGQPGFHCLSGRDGHVLKRYPECAVTYGRAAFLDVDGDGEEELVVPIWNAGLQAWKHGIPQPLWSVACGTVMSAPLLVDLDGDGKPEIVVTYGAGDRKSGVVLAVDRAGAVRWGAELPEYVRTTPAAVDVDGDGKPEILVCAQPDLYVLDRAGRGKARWNGAGMSLYPPLVVKSEDGARQELVVGCATGVARLRLDGKRVWSYEAAPVIGAVGIAEVPGAGRVVVGVDTKGRFFVVELATGREVWRWETGAMCEGGVTLADLDGDGVPEAIFGSYDYHLYAVDLR